MNPNALDILENQFIIQLNMLRIDMANGDSRFDEEELAEAIDGLEKALAKMARLKQCRAAEHE